MKKRVRAQQRRQARQERRQHRVGERQQERERLLRRHREATLDLFAVARDWLHEQQSEGEMVAFDFPDNDRVYETRLADAPPELASTPLAAALLEHLRARCPEHRVLTLRATIELMAKIHSETGGYGSTRIVHPGNLS